MVSPATSNPVSSGFTLLNVVAVIQILAANFLAQTEALMKGKTRDEAAEELAKMEEPARSKLIPHKVYELFLFLLVTLCILWFLSLRGCLA